MVSTIRVSHPLSGPGWGPPGSGATRGRERSDRPAGVKNRARKGPTLEPRSGSKITARPSANRLHREHNQRVAPPPSAERLPNYPRPSADHLHRGQSQRPHAPRRRAAKNLHPPPADRPHRVQNQRVPRPRGTERLPNCTPPSAHRPHRGQSQRTPHHETQSESQPLHGGSSSPESGVNSARPKVERRNSQRSPPSLRYH